MKRPKGTWYLLIALLIFLPVGLRVLTWWSPRSQPVDVAMAQAGKELFVHEWTPGSDPLTPDGDGLGPVYNATSCAACHHQGGVGGSGGLEHNVTTFMMRTGRGADQVREGVVHAFAVKPVYQETLSDLQPNLPKISRPSLTSLLPQLSLPHCKSGDRESINQNLQTVHLSQRNTPALFGAKLIDEIPDRVILANERSQRLLLGMAPAESEEVPVGRALHLSNGRIGHFGWKAHIASLSDFVQAACANELGLGNPGQAQPSPLGQPDYRARGLDLTLEQCDQLTAFVASLPRPVERIPETPWANEQIETGKQLFRSVGCADCHTPNLGSVEGIYSDLLLHRMGQDLVGGGSYGEPPRRKPEFGPSDGPRPDEWRTPPLWGVADSAPYLHDGRAATLEDAIRMHAGQGARAAKSFAELSKWHRDQLVTFLRTLQAP